MYTEEPKSASDRLKASGQYQVEFVSIQSVKPSPENDLVYGEIEHDEQMDLLIKSVRKRGLEEPIIVSSDDYIISGHRRFFACSHIGMDVIPIRRKKIVRAESETRWAKLLTEYNPQRIKKTSSLLKEAMLRFSDGDAQAALQSHEESSIVCDAEYLAVSGTKTAKDISENRTEFLEAAKAVIAKMRSFWPLSVRQVHYQLLNTPPLKQTPKRSKYDAEHYRYKNDDKSYDSLVELLKDARYSGLISMDCIDDPTRPCFLINGYTNASSFIETEIYGFLCGYHINRQLDQPRHIEMLGEKNTLAQILKPICRQYYVPLSIGRGYGSIPTWRDMARRFKSSGKKAMTLIVASDYDPEGLDLADDAIRSLRDLFRVPVDYHRVALNREHIDDLDLAEDFNPAKETSSRLKAFIEKTGDTKTWELESIPPEYLQDQVRAAIEANMDMDIYDATVQKERADANYLQEVRKEVALSLEVR